MPSLVFLETVRGAVKTLSSIHGFKVKGCGSTMSRGGRELSTVDHSALSSSAEDVKRTHSTTMVSFTGEYKRLKSK